MKFNQVAVVALVLFALIVIDVEGSQNKQFCAPDAFDWLIENCPTSAPAKRSSKNRI